MSCPEAARCLAAYLDGSLALREQREFEQHCAECGECRELISVWTALEELPEPPAVPTGALRVRLLSQTHFDQHAPSAAPVFSTRPWAHSLSAAAAALLLVALGWLAGQRTAPPSPETAALRDEVRHLRSLVAVSMLNQDSAAARLQGISYAGRLREGGEVTAALIAALKYDSNVNVRLAAADALRRYSGDATVRRAFLESLGAEESPLVKVSLIDALVNFGERGSLRSLERLRADGREDDSVKARAAKAIEQMQAQ